uniref:Uncharacterized protein n=1 Tax=Ralstonia solanacearum TaxID=305 RepID=A0A0S4TYX4_RALSL|nr:protein of unknown function [Ralstonia solanacearum]
MAQRLNLFVPVATLSNEDELFRLGPR